MNNYSNAIQSIVDVPECLSLSSESPVSLENVEIMILNGSEEFDKFELEQKVIGLGGKIVQSPPLLVPRFSSSIRFVAIAGKDCGMRVKNLKALSTIDIIDAQWILDCENVDLKLLLPFRTK